MAFKRKNKNLPNNNENTQDKIELKKEINLFRGVGIIIGVIVGSGIFVSPVGVLLHSRSIGLSFVIWAITGAFSTLGAIVYAELGVRIPKSGGEYAYILQVFGPLPAFLCMWITFVIIGAASTATNAIVFAEYFLKPLFSSCAVPASAMKLISLLAILTVCAVNIYEVKHAVRMAVVLSFAKVFALLLICGFGIYNLIMGRVEYFEAPFEGSTYTLGPMALAIYQGFWAYSGWNYLNFLTNEIKSPAKNLPRAILLSMLLITIIYLITNISYLTVMSPFEMLRSAEENSAAIAVVFAERTMGVMAWVMPVFVGASVFGSMNGEVMSMSRLVFTAAEEGHMPSALAMISVKFMTPLPAVLAMMVLSISFTFYSNLFYLIELTSFAFALISTTAVLCLLYLRYQDWRGLTAQSIIPAKSFKLPIVLPIIFLFINGFIFVLTVLQSPYDSLYTLAMMFAGVPVYWLGISWQPKPAFMEKCILWTTLLIQKTLNVVRTERVQSIALGLIEDETSSVMNGDCNSNLKWEQESDVM